MMHLLFILSWVLIGYITSRQAVRRGRNPAFWFFIGMIFGVFGLLTLLLLPGPMSKHESQKTIATPAPSQPLTPPDEIQGKIWYYLDNEHQQQGPMSFDKLKDNWQKQAISEHTLIWNESLDEWKTIKEIIKKEWLEF